MLMAKRSFFNAPRSRFPGRTNLVSLCVVRTTNPRTMPSFISAAKPRHRQRRSVIDVFKRIMRDIRPAGTPRRRNLFRRRATAVLRTMMPMRMSSSLSPWINNGSSKLNRTTNETSGFKRSNSRFSSVYKTLNRPKPREQQSRVRRRSLILPLFKQSNKFPAIISVLIVINSVRQPI